MYKSFGSKSWTKTNNFMNGNELISYFSLRAIIRCYEKDILSIPMILNAIHEICQWNYMLNEIYRHFTFTNMDNEYGYEK